MAQMKLRDGFLGDYYTFPIWELDFAGMATNLASAFATDSNRYTGSANKGLDFMTIDSGQASELHWHRAKITSTLLKDYIASTIPHQRNQYGKPTGVDGAICQFNTNIQRNTTYPYADYGMELVTGAEPSDYNVNFHYASFDTQNTSGFDGGYSRVGYCYNPTSSGSWNTGSRWKNVHDKNCAMFHQLYTGVGSCHFSVMKQPMASIYYPSYYAPGINVGGGYSGSSTNTQVGTAVCNKDNIPLYTKLPNHRYGCAIVSDNSNSFSSEGNQYTQRQNIWQFFVHYTIGGRDFYGICQAKFTNGWNDTDYPTEFDIMGMGLEFWGDSIIPGGGGGEGEWGSKTVHGGGHGTFTTSTSQRDKAVPGTAPADIVATINVNLDDKIFGSSDLSNDSKYCLQTFDEANWKHFIDVLYSDDYIKKYTNAYYNPMSAIPVAHLLPEAFVDERLNGGGSGNMNQINVSAAGLTFTYEEGGGSLNVKSTKVYPMTYVKSEVLDLSSTYYDAFPDYEGFTKITLHIPFIGDVPIDVNKVMGGRLQITLTCDCQNGNLAAWIWTEDKDEQSDYTLIATGNCSYPLPVASMSSDPSSMGKIASGLISAVGGLAAIAAAPVTGGASLTIGGAAAVAAGSASAISGAVQMEHQRSTQVRYNNSGALSLMTDPELWVDITRPVWVEPDNYQKLYGLPSFMGNTIMECPSAGDPDVKSPFMGFLVIDAIDLTGIEGPTEEEKQMIEEQLAKGVFIDYDHIGE